MPGAHTYPIVATVFVLMHKTMPLQRRRSSLALFEWSLDNGAADAAELGYVPLPPSLVSTIRDYWTKGFRSGS
jgi:phosphate transport system substrate-binding protein